MPATTRTDPYATYARALTLGVVTGLRSQTGLAAIALKRETEGRADLEAATIIAPNVAAGYADDGVTLKTVMAQQ